MRFESAPVTADGTQIPYEFTGSRLESTDEDGAVEGRGPGRAAEPATSPDGRPVTGRF